MTYSQRYVKEERRSRWPAAAATRCPTRGWADLRRRAALLVARVLVFAYATLLPGPTFTSAGAGAPCAARVLAQRGRGDLGDRFLYASGSSLRQPPSCSC